jgi:membrane associated rhomboid family serine protease
MINASVGFQCPECARAGRQKVITARSLGGARPIVTQVLIAANVAVFIWGAVRGGSAEVAQRGDLAAGGGLIASKIADGEWWRIVTAGFLHAGLLHLAFNMAALWILGAMVEPALGKVRFAALYATSLLAGSLGALLLEPNALTVGASGAIFGLMGAAVAGQRARGINPWDSGIMSLIVVNLLITFAIPGISKGGHLGGLIGGFVAGWLLFDLPQRIKASWLPVAGCAAMSAGLVMASLAVAATH